MGPPGDVEASRMSGVSPGVVVVDEAEGDKMPDKGNFVVYEYPFFKRTFSKRK